MDECKFFHTPGDGNFYLVNCKKILHDSDDNDDDNGIYDHGFFYKNLTAKYHITCKLYSHSLIENILNKEVFGMDININYVQQRESLSLNQKFCLQEGLERILPSHFLQYHTSESITAQETDYQNSLNNGLSLQDINGAGGHQQQVLQQHRETSPCYNANTNSFHENDMNNVVTRQVISTMDTNQDYINVDDLSCNNHINIIHQGVNYNHIINPSQQVDLTDFSHHNISEKEMRHPLHGNGDNITHAFSTMDINQDYNDGALPNDNYISHQGVIRIESYHSFTPRVNSQDFFDNN